MARERYTLCGGPSDHRLDEQRCARLVKLGQADGEQYADVGPTLVAEKLAACDGERISAGAVRRLMMRHGPWKTCTSRWRHREMREPRTAWGDSASRWQVLPVVLESCGESDAVALIDDATSEGGYAVFVEAETTAKVMRAMWAHVKRRGVTRRLYVDRDAIYVAKRQATLEEK